MTTFLSKYSLKIPVSRLVSFSQGMLIYAFVSVNKMQNEKNKKMQKRTRTIVQLY